MNFHLFIHMSAFSEDTFNYNNTQNNLPPEIFKWQSYTLIKSNLTMCWESKQQVNNESSKQY